MRAEAAFRPTRHHQRNARAHFCGRHAGRFRKGQLHRERGIAAGKIIHAAIAFCLAQNRNNAGRIKPSCGKCGLERRHIGRITHGQAFNNCAHLGGSSDFLPHVPKALA